MKGLVVVDIPKSVYKHKTIVTHIGILEDGMNISKLIEYIKNSDYSIDQVYIDYEPSSSYLSEEGTWSIIGRREETDAEVKARVDEWVTTYNIKKAELEKIAEKKRAKRSDKEWKEFQRLKKKFSID